MKRELGQYYTVGNPFSLAPFREWARRARLESETVLEPFAGANNIVSLLKKLFAIKRADSFDIAPNRSDVVCRDTLADFPGGYKVCVTNPPWLAKNSATRRGITFPNPAYDDIYKFALVKCLGNCEFVAAIVPESFITAGIFCERLDCVISLAAEMFNDTDAPACLALFDNDVHNDFTIYRNDECLGTFREMQKFIPRSGASGAKREIKFNAPNGNLGLFAVDDTRGASIRFCDSDELKNYRVRHSC